MIVEIPINPYPKKLYLIWEELDSAVQYYFHRHPDDFKAIFKLPASDEANTIRTPGGNVCVRFSVKPTNPGSIAHEAFHATYNILDYVGMGLSHSSEEGYCYLLDWIVVKIYEELEKEI